MNQSPRGTKATAEYRRGELARDVMRLIGTGIIIGSSAVSAISTSQILGYLNPKGRTERNKISNSIRYLARHGDIEIIEDRDGTEYLHLTERGRARFDEERIWEMRLNSAMKWDRKWRLVLFDFPSDCKSRHAFRSKLEDFGFEMYQRSVFIFPHECREEVSAVARWYGVDEYVQFIVATEIRDTRRFAEIFDLL